LLVVVSDIEVSAYVRKFVIRLLRWPHAEITGTAPCDCVYIPQESAADWPILDRLAAVLAFHVARSYLQPSRKLIRRAVRVVNLYRPPPGRPGPYRKIDRAARLP